ncbi:MAG: putative aspartyl protease [Cyclobacteriaceae bacterium]|jgi:predicted aspartyl protease
MKKIIIFGLLLSTLKIFAQSPVATTPFELFGDHIFIKLSVNGSEPLDFIFDSGSGITVIDTDAALSLKLDLSHKETVAGAQASIQGAKIKHNKINMGDIKIEGDVTLEAFDLTHLGISIGKNIDGIIGHDLLHHHVARVNYDDMIVEIYSPDESPKTGKKVSFTLHNGIPVIQAQVTLNNDQTIDGTFYVNTGAGTSLDFNTPFAKEKDIINKTGNHYSYLVKGVEEKESKHYEGRIKSFDLGFYLFTNMPVGISQASGGLQGDKKVSGILGNKALSRFNITFDYKNLNLYFEPNANIDKAFLVNCSGLDVQMGKDMIKVLIHQVQDEGPAKKAGVITGDELISVNGRPASEMTLAEIEDLLKVAASEIILEVMQGADIKKVSFKLENLL